MLYAVVRDLFLPFQYELTSIFPHLTEMYVLVHSFEVMKTSTHEVKTNTFHDGFDPGENALQFRDGAAATSCPARSGAKA